MDGRPNALKRVRTREEFPFLLANLLRFLAFCANEKDVWHAKPQSLSHRRNTQQRNRDEEMKLFNYNEQSEARCGQKG